MEGGTGPFPPAVVHQYATTCRYCLQEADEEGGGRLVWCEIRAAPRCYDFVHERCIPEQENNAPQEPNQVPGLANGRLQAVKEALEWASIVSIACTVSTKAW